MAFPTTIDSFTTKNSGETISESHVNDLQTSVVAIETKIGIDTSAVQSSLDYKVTHLPSQLQNWDMGSYAFRAQTLYLDKSTGTAPMTILSTTKVANLNVDALDGAHATTTPTAGEIAILDSNANFAASTLRTYDSGWFGVSPTNLYVKTHNLGTTALIARLYWASNTDGAFMQEVSNVFSGVSDSGSMIGSMSNNSFIIYVGSNLTGYIDGVGGYGNKNRGFLRAIALVVG